MNASEKEMWETNIANLAEEVAEKLGWDTVEFIYVEHGATDIVDLDPSQYSKVFNHLYYLAND